MPCRLHMISDLTGIRTCDALPLRAPCDRIACLAYRRLFSVMKVVFQADISRGMLDDVQSVHAVRERVYLLSRLDK